MLDDESELAAVFIAATVAEADFAEKLLDDEGIEYEVRPEAFLKSGMFGSACLTGVLFEVRAGQAAYCRRLFRERGLVRGVIDIDEV